MDQIPTDKNDVVDGFSDAPEGAKNTPDAADKGNQSENEPLSPDEYAKAQKEAREEE